MSDVVATPDAASVSIDPSAAPAAKPAVPAQQSAEPDWLPARLEQAKRSALKDAGFESLDAAKKAADAIKAQEEANKSESDKRVQAEKELERTRKKNEEMGEALGAYAKSQMGALNEAQRAAVMAVAGDDAAKQLKTIEALKPTWAGQAAPAAAPPAADTAPARSAPNASAGASPTDHKAVYAELVKTNPIFAARYAQEHGVFNP